MVFRQVANIQLTTPKRHANVGLVTEENKQVVPAETPVEKAPEPSERETQPETKLIMGVPMDVIMRGGTKSSQHDALMHKYRTEDEARRVESDKEKAIASTPIEDGGGMMYTNRMTDSPEAETAKVLLQYMMIHGREVEFECLADVTILETGELELILVCPRCVSQGVPHGRAQLKIRQSNKPWELDMRKVGEPIMFDGAFYRSAGRVRECPLSRCPDCNWSFKIDDNKVWPQ